MRWVRAVDECRTVVLIKLSIGSQVESWLFANPLLVNYIGIKSGFLPLLALLCKTIRVCIHQSRARRDRHPPSLWRMSPQPAGLPLVAALLLLATTAHGACAPPPPPLCARLKKLPCCPFRQSPWRNGWEPRRWGPKRGQVAVQPDELPAVDKWRMGRQPGGLHL